MQLNLWPGMPGVFRFVVKQHHATSLHYDLRLEYVDGRGILVLASWCLPHGPTLDPAIHRLAIRVGDHKVEYMKFEGVRPEGLQGAGPIQLWDMGTYKIVGPNETSELQLLHAIETGWFMVYLEGEKLRGNFEMKRVKLAEREEWTFRKVRDVWAQPFSNVTLDQPQSVSSKLTLEQIKEIYQRSVSGEKLTGDLFNDEAA